MARERAARPSGRDRVPGLTEREAERAVLNQPMAGVRAGEGQALAGLGLLSEVAESSRWYA
jgi:hypothetical protein